MNKALAVVLMLGLAGAVLAHEGEHHILGKVIAIGENSITVETVGNEPKKVPYGSRRRPRFKRTGLPPLSRT